VAISFCILSRIEEADNTDLDCYQRYKIQNDSVYLAGHYGSPIVDYFLKIMIDSLNFKITPNTKFSIMLTHDVDRLRSYQKLSNSLRLILGDAFKRRNLKKFLSRIYDEIYPFEPWLSLREIRKIYKDYNSIQIVFMIMGESNNPKDAEYFKRFPGSLKRFLKVLKKNNFCIGIHPGVETYKNLKEYSKQKKSIENLINSTIKISRQHVLKFDIVKTPKICQANGILQDLTMSYPECPGFRNGTSRGMYAYDFKSRELIDVLILSTPIMDLTLHEDKYADFSSNEVIQLGKRIIDDCIKYDGKLIMLYHTGFIIHRFKKIIRFFLDYACKQTKK